MSKTRTRKELPVEKYKELMAVRHNRDAVERFTEYFPITLRQAAHVIFHHQRRDRADYHCIFYSIEVCGEYDEGKGTPQDYVMQLATASSLRYSTVRKFIETYRMTSIPLVDLRVKQPTEPAAKAPIVVNVVETQPTSQVRLTYSEVALAVADLVDEDLAAPLTLKIAGRALELIAAKYKERE